MAKTLRIVIPTLNPDTELLKASVTSIHSVFGGSSEVAICLVDNGSNLLPNFQFKTRAGLDFSLETIRFDHDLGFSWNLLRAAGKFSEPFIWFIGDDDLIHPQAETIPTFLATNVQENMFLLSATHFDQGESPNWEKSESPEGIFAGAAISSVILRREVFLSLGREVLSCSKDSMWIHLLVKFILESRSKTPPKIPGKLVAIRNARRQNWESHFGNQYLAGVNLVESANELANFGFLSPEVLSELVTQRLRTNLIDVISLASNLTRIQLSGALKALSAAAVRANLRIGISQIVIMNMPSLIRKFLGLIYKLGSNLKKFARKLLNQCAPR